MAEAIQNVTWEEFSTNPTVAKKLKGASAERVDLLKGAFDTLQAQAKVTTSKAEVGVDAVKEGAKDVGIVEPTPSSDGFLDILKTSNIPTGWVENVDKTHPVVHNAAEAYKALTWSVKGGAELLTPFGPQIRGGLESEIDPVSQAKAIGKGIKDFRTGSPWFFGLEILSMIPAFKLGKMGVSGLQKVARGVRGSREVLATFSDLSVTEKTLYNQILNKVGDQGIEIKNLPVEAHSKIVKWVKPGDGGRRVALGEDVSELQLIDDVVKLSKERQELINRVPVIEDSVTAGAYQKRLDENLKIDMSLEWKNRFGKAADEWVQKMSRGKFGIISPERFKKSVVDAFRPVEKVQDELFRNGKAIAEDMDVVMARTGYDGKVVSALEANEAQLYEPLKKAIVNSNVDWNDLRDFVEATQALHRNSLSKSGRVKGGMTSEAAQGILNKLKDDGLMDTINRLAPEVYKIGNIRLKRLLQAGHITPEEVANWKQVYGETYVPLQGFLEKKHMVAEVGGVIKDTKRGKEFIRTKGFRGGKEPIKVARGRTERAGRAEDPILRSILNLNAADVAIRENEIGQTLLKLTQTHNLPALWKVKKLEKGKGIRKKMVKGTGAWQYDYPKPGPNQVLVHTPDKGHYLITLKDPNMAKAFNGKRLFENLAPLKVTAAINRWLAMVNTSLTPEFWMTNFVRDQGTGLINMMEQGVGAQRKGKGFVSRLYGGVKDRKLAIQGLRGKGEWADVAKQFEANGGKIGFFGLEDFATAQKNLVRDLNAMSKGNIPGARASFAKSMKSMQDISGAMENSTRLVAFKYAVDAGVSPKMAAEMAKNLTVNFNKKGELGVLFNSLYLFSNAGIQGTNRLLKAAKNPKVQRLLGGVMGGAMVHHTSQRFVGGKDQDGTWFYDKVPQHVKDKNLVFMTGDGKGTYAKVPMPYGYNWFVNIAGLVVDWNMSKEAKSKLMGNFMAMTMDSFNPIGGTGSPLRMLSPDATDIIHDLSVNETAFGGPIHPEKTEWNKNLPESQRYWSTTEGVWKGAAQVMNAIGGGTQVKQSDIMGYPFMDVHPNSIEYLPKFGLGGVYNIFDHGIAMVSNIATGDEWINNVPVGRRFWGRVNPMYDKVKFYDNMDRVLDAIADKKVVEARDLNIKEQMGADGIAWAGLADLAKDITEELKPWREIKNTAMEDGNHNDIREADKAINQIMQDFNMQVRQTLEAEGQSR